MKGKHVVYGLLKRYPLVFMPNQVEIISHRQRLLKSTKLPIHPIEKSLLLIIQIRYMGEASHPLPASTLT